MLGRPILPASCAATRAHSVSSVSHCGIRLRLMDANESRSQRDKYSRLCIEMRMICVRLDKNANHSHQSAIFTRADACERSSVDFSTPRTGLNCRTGRIDQYWLHSGSACSDAPDFGFSWHEIAPMGSVRQTVQTAAAQVMNVLLTRSIFIHQTD
jgi:hypothetical protein